MAAALLGGVVTIGPNSAVRADTVSFTAQLTGDADNAATPTASRGNMTLSLDKATKIATWRVDYSGLPGSAHGFACGALDTLTGPPIEQRGNLASPITGSKALTDQDIAQLGAGRWVCVIDGENDDAEIGGVLKSAP